MSGPSQTIHSRTLPVLASAVVAGAVVGAVVRGVPGASGSPVRIRLLCRLQDPSITESSGLAASRRQRGVFWTHNDSGDVARVFAFDGRGRTLATCPVPDAGALDWEDMAIGPGPEHGRDYLYLGDIGDNARMRETIQVYRVPEPRLDTRRAGVHAATEPAARIVLRYPDGPHNAEGLFIGPRDGDLFIVTKELSTPATVFRTRAPLRSEGVHVMEIAGSVPLASITGAAISPNGRRAAVRSYEKALEYRLPRGQPLDHIWSVPPADLPLPDARGGEALTYSRDGRAILTSTEGVNAPIHEISLGR